MRLFNSQKLKIFTVITVSTSVFLLSACSNDIGVYNEGSEKKYFQELINAPVKEVVALKVNYPPLTLSLRSGGFPRFLVKTKTPRSQQNKKERGV